ncbi:ABC transporter substrate-binding protein [Ancylobacter lacus]|uniref:ABC transporter substrate-binding protein n=1 Tax=Ancylobacter lacus TaxID=2579970 RepID=UPI001BD13296|nr:extracellular solute-binding protein [Ancylobacter lacus]MBS7537509.1 extracellular solute-binding protein [Ancylobacter lacus]
MNGHNLATPSSRPGLSRRAVLKAAAAGAAVLAAPGLIRQARAATPTVRIMGVETAALTDWSAFEKETGLTVEFTGINSDPGIFRQEVVANAAGERIDIFLMDGGIEDELGTKGFFAPIDTAKVKGWGEAPAAVMNSPLAQGPDGQQFGMPVVMNADSFAYYPEAIDEKEPLSYALLFESDTTLGKVALENTWLTSLPMAATYLKVTGRQTIADPSNMTPAEAKAVVDFLVARKKAGQFRALWSTFEESIDLMARKEVVAINCWEPAVKELHKQGKDVRYAFTREGYNKWMICAYVPKEAATGARADIVAKALSGFLGGAYAAQIAVLRGYATANAKAGLAYAETQKMPAEDIESIKANIAKIEKKFAAPLFWQNAAPANLQAIEAEWERFRQA